MAEREHYATAMVGRKHTGKSTWLCKLALDYSKGTGKRVLVLNVNGSPAYNNIQKIDFEQFKRWKKGVKQFYCMEPEAVIEFLAENCNADKPFDGMLIFEDSTKYIDSNPTKKQKAILVDHRMYQADIYFTFHSIKVIPRFFYDMLNFITIKKTNDLIEENKRWYFARVPNFQEVYACHTTVMKSRSKYKTITVATGL